MAYVPGNLVGLVNAAPGRMLYRYDAEDDMLAVELAGYFNNADDDLNLQIGDVIFVFEWSATPFAAASTLVASMSFAVTNVIANDAAAAAGNVNIAEVFTTSGAVSSLA